MTEKKIIESKIEGDSESDSGSDSESEIEKGKNYKTRINTSTNRTNLPNENLADLAKMYGNHGNDAEWLYKLNKE